MTFETADGVAAWKAANVSHDQWTDWVDWFESPLDKAFTVAEELKRLGKFHKPTQHAYLSIEDHAPKVDFLFESGEDTFRDLSGTIAAVLRASAPHGARGTFYFLGTAGAEYDFTYKLEIANGHSTLESLHQTEIATIYEGDAYQQFLTTVMTELGTLGEARSVHGKSSTKHDGEPETLPVEAIEATMAPEPAANAATPKPAAQPAAKAAAKPAAKAAAKPAAKAAAKPVAKAAAKPAAKKAVAKPAKKVAAKPATKKPAAKKPAAKKAAAKKR